MTKSEAMKLKAGDVVIRPYAGEKFIILKIDVPSDRYWAVDYNSNSIHCTTISSLTFTCGNISWLWEGRLNAYLRHYSIKNHPIELSGFREKVLELGFGIFVEEYLQQNNKETKNND